MNLALHTEHNDEVSSQQKDYDHFQKRLHDHKEEIVSLHRAGKGLERRVEDLDEVQRAIHGTIRGIEDVAHGRESGVNRAESRSSYVEPPVASRSGTRQESPEPLLIPEPSGHVDSDAENVLLPSSLSSVEEESPSDVEDAMADERLSCAYGVRRGSGRFQRPAPFPKMALGYWSKGEAKRVRIKRARRGDYSRVLQRLGREEDPILVEALHGDPSEWRGDLVA